MPLIDSRPDAVDQLIRPGVTYTLTLPWPAGELTGRSFTSTLAGVALDLTVDGDTMTIEATDTITGALDVGVPVQWLLLEAIDGTDEPILVGTWTPSDSPRAASSSTVTVDVGGATVQVTVNSAQASVAALDTRLDTAETDVTTLEAARPRLVEWREADGWDAWTEVDVSEVAPGDAALTVSGGIGTATDVAADGNDRRLFISDALPSGVADVEVYADVTLGKQVGLAMRYQSTGAATGVAVIVWSNIIFAANGSILLGVWEFDGTNAGLVLNQSVTSLPGFVSPILSAAGDGSTVTVRTKRSHELVVGNIIALEDVGAFGQVTVATIVDATTFTFTDATVGSWTGGTWRWVIHAGRRKLAARLVGDRITWKQWFPSEAEPSWADPDRAVSALLPATLEDSGLPPPSDGGVGFLVAHLGQGGGGGVVSVNDFAVRVLD